MTRDGDENPAIACSRVGVGVAGLVLVAALLPSPARLFAGVAGSDPIDVLGSAMLLAAALVVWGLLGWAVVVGLAAVLARMPGVTGRLGRSALRRLTPAMARRILIAATGVSLIAGASACASPAGAGGGYGSVRSAAGGTAVTAPAVTATAVTATAATATAVTGPAVTAPPGGNSVGEDPAGPDDLPDLDWPVQGRAEAPPPADTAGPTGAIHTPATAASPTTTPTARAGGAHTTGTAMTRATPTDSVSASPTIATSVATNPAGPAASVGPNVSPVLAPSAGAATPAKGPAGRTTAGRPIPIPGASAPGAATAEVPHRDGDAASSTRPAGATPATPLRPAAPHHAPSAATTLTVTVTVRTGDTLWAIAARHLLGTASDVQIDAAWHAWYAANRAVIGSDPDLIRPGQQLAAPSTEVVQP